MVADALLLAAVAVFLLAARGLCAGLSELICAGGVGFLAIYSV